jgi:hypothetical protein
MRLYALALGILMTVGYGCVAEMAVAEVRREHYSPPAASPDAVWLGGILAPVTVEAERPAPPRAHGTWT